MTSSHRSAEQGSYECAPGHSALAAPRGKGMDQNVTPSSTPMWRGAPNWVKFQRLPTEFAFTR